MSLQSHYSIFLAQSQVSLCRLRARQLSKYLLQASSNMIEFAFDIQSFSSFFICDFGRNDFHKAYVKLSRKIFNI